MFKETHRWQEKQNYVYTCGQSKNMKTELYEKIKYFPAKTPNKILPCYDNFQLSSLRTSKMWTKRGCYFKFPGFTVKYLKNTQLLTKQIEYDRFESWKCYDFFECF